MLSVDSDSFSTAKSCQNISVSYGVTRGIFAEDAFAHESKGQGKKLSCSAAFHQ
jgi:hypothetical protein